MSQNAELTRRNFLVSAAAALLAASLPKSVKSDVEVNDNVDWEEILNRVIGHRNALITGMAKGPQHYEIGSPEWCMEEALAADGLLGGAQS